MSSRSSLFVPSDSLPPRFDAVGLRAYLGGDVTVREAEYNGDYGFLVETTSATVTKKKIAALKGDRERHDQGKGRSQVSRSFSQDSTETYSSTTSSYLYPQQATNQSTTGYRTSHDTYGSPQWSSPSIYDTSPRINEAHYATGMDSLSRHSSRNDTYEQYPASDRPGAGFAYASSGGSQPIAITSQRRPSTFSVASDDSFDSTYGFRGSVRSSGFNGLPASPRGGHQSSTNIYGPR